MAATDLAAIWGPRIRRRRRELEDQADNTTGRREWSVTSVARQVGISRRYLHAIENGERVPSDDVRVELARVLRVEVGEIFTYDLREVS